MKKKLPLYAFIAFALLAFLSPDCATSRGSRQQSLPTAWTFAVVSDTQGDNSEVPGKSCLNDQVVSAIAESIALAKPDLVLVSGDLVNGWHRNSGTDYSTQYANWKQAMSPVYGAGIRVYPIRGNHDSGPERVVLPPLPAQFEPPPGALERLKSAYLSAVVPPYIPQNGPEEEKGLTYSFVHKNALIIGLDQFTAEQHRINQSWLDQQLTSNESPHVFVYGHEPAFETDHKDNLGFYAKERDLFWNSLGRAGARVYFCGHDHYYNRALIADAAGNEIRQIVNGTGGGRLRTWSGTYPDGSKVKGEFHNGDHHGYVLVSIEGPKATITWQALVMENNAPVWKPLDSFSYTLNAQKAE